MLAVFITAGTMGQNAVQTVKADAVFPEMIVSAASLSTSDEFLKTAVDASNTTTYTGISQSTGFNMNGRTYYQGLVFSGGASYNSTNTSSIAFNTEKISSFSCTIGHIDNTTRDSAVVKIYLDDVLEEEFKITSNMPLTSYSVDVSKAALLKISVVRNSDSAYGFGNIAIDGEESNISYDVPSFSTAEAFFSSGYNIVNTSWFNGKSSADTFQMNGRTYYQGLVFSGGASYNSTNTSRICFNTENVSTFSCTMGHLDNYTRDSATVSVYLDDVLYEEFKLTSNMPLEKYTLDLNGAKNVLFVVTRNSDSAFAFADISVDDMNSVKACTIPEYDSAENFLTAGYNSANISAYDGKSKAVTFNMNGRTYYQGLVFSGGASYNSTNTSRVCFNTENISTFSCTMGHLDNYTRDSATVSVYLDDVLYEEFKLTSNMPLEKYTLDLNGAKNVLFVVTRNSDSAFAFADISVDDMKSVRTCTVPEYNSAENFLTSGYNAVNISTYDGKSKATIFRMNRRNYYQGIVFSGGASYNSTNTSRVCFNTENIKKFSCTLGHLDDSTRKSAKVAVYLDDVLYEEFELTGNMLPKAYSLDLNDVKNLLFVITRESDSAYCFADISVDSYESVKKCTVPEYASDEEFIQDGFAKESVSIYDGKSQAVNFSMNGTAYNQGFLFSGGASYNSTNTSRIYFNTENVSEFSCKIGHVDDSTQKDAKIDIYLDNELSETLQLTSDMKILNYTLDTSSASNLAIIVTRNGDSQYAMADVQIHADSAPTEPEEQPSEVNDDFIYGDVDGSGEVNILDVITVNRAVLGKEILSDTQCIAADVNHTGVPDSADSLMILKYIVGLLKELK